ncbi:MAG: pyridoxal-phosphate dependent enzyme, partial [Deltaproteobacteria bacterium]|nr:pyridoxal-phosphate dependent enzyme [Deltaproteobacteria bacterium]
ERLDRLSAAWGGPTIWVKRDDLTGFGLSGNKVRKLEFHIAAARAAGADTVITCGAEQSNHCRATALVAARLGFHCIVVLRTADGDPVVPAGNHLLDRLAGAEVVFTDPAGYERRDATMAELAASAQARGRRTWIIPEGASDELGMWGFVLAMRELAQQLEVLPVATPPTIWHAASSGGTTAGLGWGADRLNLTTPIVASSVGETASDLTARVEDIWRDAVVAHGGRMPNPPVTMVDDYVGEGYGVAATDELASQREATTLTGLLFDPTYTGKALHGLRVEIAAGRWSPDEHVVFWHTGGGFALFAQDPARLLPDDDPT